MFTEWSDLKKPNAGAMPGIKNIRLEDGKPVTLRFVTKPKKILRYWIDGKSAICADRENCTVHKKYGKEPEVRYVVQAIDRADGKLGILECSPPVLKPVSTWATARRRDPDDPKQGIDFEIKRTGQKKLTRYEVVPLDPTPLTDAEITMVEGKYDLEKLFKPTPDAEIEVKLGLVAGSAPAATVTTATAGTTAVNNLDIPF